MTYAELKQKIETLTPEQLAQTVKWVGDERGGEVEYVDISIEDLIGGVGDPDSWMPRSDAMSADPEAYADASIIAPAGTVLLVVD